MKEIRPEIEIEASAERMWQTLTDFAAFLEWNPFIRRASGEVKTGARLEVYIQPSGARDMTFRPTVSRLSRTVNCADAFEEEGNLCLQLECK
jgi:uncharacterized protein YndB with AHSA1/START domain